MCGLIGWLGHPVAFSLDAQLEYVARRGPDEKNIWTGRSLSRQVSLGHARLAINDLSIEGSQPMISGDRRYILIFNGEIYNYNSLNHRISKSHNQHQTSIGFGDTRVLLNNLIYFGVDQTLDLIDGMFAFCLLDTQKGIATLATDFFGEKPLYFANGSFFSDEPSFVFASDLFAVVSMLDRKLSVSGESLDEFFAKGYVSAPWSIFEGISKLEPGQIVRFDLSNGKVIKKSWRQRYLEQIELSDQVGSSSEFIKQINRQLHESIELRVASSDVEVGCLLSGGIDSSLVAALAAKQVKKHSFRTFSIGFENRQYDESADANFVANQIGSEHTSLTCQTDDFIRLAHQISDAYTEPFSDASQIPTMLVSEMAAKNLKVVLTGDGGDEIFGGYNRYVFSERYSWIFENIPFRLRWLIGCLLAMPSVEFYDAFGRALGLKTVRLVGDKIEKFARYISSKNMLEAYQLITTLSVSARREDGARAQNDHLRMAIFGGKFNIKRMMLLDILTYLPFDILVKVDRASMFYGLEARCPFLHKDLFMTSFRLGIQNHIKDGKGKLLLRDILKREIPAYNFDKPKMGFGIPLSSLINNELKNWTDINIEATLDFYCKDPQSQDSIYVNLKDHRRGIRNSSESLWSQAVFGQFLIKYDCAGYLKWPLARVQSHK